MINSDDTYENTEDDSNPVDLHPNEENNKRNTNSIKSKSSEGTVLDDET